MKVIRDFKCSVCEQIIEKYIDSLETEIKCECGGIAYKMLSCPRVYLDGTDPSFPGAYDKWGRDRTKRAAKQREKNS